MKLSIIILNWNGKNDTLACLEALHKQTLQPSDIMVVDNGSSDDSIFAIQQQFPTVTLLATGENLGYAGGNNVGIEYALKQGADWVLLLNNDTIPEHNFVAAFAAAAQSSPAVDIFGAYPLRFDNPERVDHLGGVWNPQTGWFDLVGRGANRGFRTSQPLDYVCGCSIFIRRSVFETIGLLEPQFFLFWEESDFCFRAKKAGFKLEVCYEAQLLHKVSASFTGGSPQKTYYLWRGRCLWVTRNCSLEEQHRIFKTLIKPQLRHLLKLLILKRVQLLFKNDPQKQGKILQYQAARQAYKDFLEMAQK